MAREQSYREWVGDYDLSDPVVRRHKRNSDLARAVAIGWIDHPAVLVYVLIARPWFEDLVQHLDLPDQGAVALAAAQFLDVAGIWPDGTQWPALYNKDTVAAEELAEAERVQPLFVEGLGNLARQIQSAGASLDPTDHGVLLALAQLTLLDTDFSRSPEDLADGLNLLPPGGFSRSAALEGHVATTTSRHGRNARFQADLAASAESYARRHGPPAIHLPYAGGHTRATRGDTVRLRHALAVLVEQDPSLTPASLLQIVNGAENPALERLRTALGAKADWQPDQRRLERNWPKSRQ